MAEEVTLTMSKAGRRGSAGRPLLRALQRRGRGGLRRAAQAARPEAGGAQPRLTYPPEGATCALGGRMPPRRRLALSCERRPRPSSTPTRPPTRGRSRCSASSSRRGRRLRGARGRRTPSPARGSRWSARSPTSSAGDRAEVSGEWQTHSRYGRQLRARGALPLDPADREGRVAYLTTLRHIGPARAERLVDEHGEGVLGAIAADPHGVFGSLRGVSAKQAAAAAESWHATPRGPRPPRPARPARARAPGGADPRPLRRAVDGDPARGPLPADRGRRGRLRPRRQDRARRRRAAGVRAGAPRPPPSSPSPRPSSRGTPTCRSTSCARAHARS